MIAHLSAVLLSGCLMFADPSASPQSTTHLEKVAEGQYSRWQDGHFLKNTELTWTLWRTADGFALEAKLPPNMAALWAAALKDMASPELKKEIQQPVPTNLDLQFTKEMAVQKLLLEGVSLSDQKHVVVVDCSRSDNEISCRGPGVNESRKNPGSEQLLYAYPFPLLFTPVLKNFKSPQNQATPIKLIVLEEVKGKLRLMEAPGQIQPLGTEKITIGEYTFDTEKYVVALAMKSGERKIALWTKNDQTVFMMEDSLLAPGIRIMLSQYKRYSDF